MAILRGIQDEGSEYELIGLEAKLLQDKHGRSHSRYGWFSAVSEDACLSQSSKCGSNFCSNYNGKVLAIAADRCS